MIPEPFRRKSRRALAAIDPYERRGWLTHSIAALTVSALGLAVAGSVALNSAAEPSFVSAQAPNVTASTANGTRVGQAPQQQSLQTRSMQQPGSQQGSVDDSGADESSPFGRRDTQAEDPSRSESRQLQAQERDAFRDEALAREAESAEQTAHEETLKRRAKDLSESEREGYENAVRIARERSEAAARRLAAQNSQSAPDLSSDAPVEDDSNDNGGDDASEAPSGGGGGSASPVPGAVIGAYFGQTGLWARYHTGLDFRAGSGTPIKSVKSGTVMHAGYGGNAGSWAGNYVAIKHSDGNTTLYAHMSSNSVSAGQRVEAGEVIGRVGSTGRSFGAHLHFELYQPGARYGDVYSASNPQPWLNAIGVSTR